MQKKASDIASQAGKEYFKQQVVDIGASIRNTAAAAASGAKAAEMEQRMKEKVLAEQRYRKYVAEEKEREEKRLARKNNMKA